MISEHQLSTYGILLIAACVFVEGLLRLPIIERVNRMRRTLVRVRFVLGATAVSDHWKEQALLAYASKLWTDSAILFLCLLLLGGSLLLVFNISNRLDILNPEVMSSVDGIILATLAGTIYGLVRSRGRRPTDV